MPDDNTIKIELSKRSQADQIKYLKEQVTNLIATRIDKEKLKKTIYNLIDEIHSVKDSTTPEDSELYYLKADKGVAIDVLNKLLKDLKLSTYNGKLVGKKGEKVILKENALDGLSEEGYFNIDKAEEIGLFYINNKEETTLYKVELLKDLRFP